MGVDPSFERCEEWAMFSKTAKPIMRSAAWRISMWATLAFACGTMVVFIFLHQFVAGDIQRRTDAWLAGEARSGLRRTSSHTISVHFSQGAPAPEGIPALVAACQAAGLRVESHMKGGIQAWKAAGLPTISVDPATGQPRETR